jgi:hypothetical protein
MVEIFRELLPITYLREKEYIILVNKHAKI